MSKQIWLLNSPYQQFHSVVKILPGNYFRINWWGVPPNSKQELKNNSTCKAFIQVLEYNSLFPVLRHQNGFRLPMCQCHLCFSPSLNSEVDVTSGSWHAHQRPFLVFSVDTAKETQEQWLSLRTSRAHCADTRIPSVCLCQHGTWTEDWAVNCYQTDRFAPQWSARMSDLRLLVFPCSKLKFLQKSSGLCCNFYVLSQELILLFSVHWRFCSLLLSSPQHYCLCCCL